MARYLMLLRHKPTDFEGLDGDDMNQMMMKFKTWTETMAKADQLVAVENLKQGGRTLRKRDALVVDGPYVETKEAVVGFYLVEADDYDAATKLAEGCPCVEYGGTVELRECDSF